jgi:hypothetical protein
MRRMPGAALPLPELNRSPAHIPLPAAIATNGHFGPDAGRKAVKGSLSDLAHNGFPVLPQLNQECIKKDKKVAPLPRLRKRPFSDKLRYCKGTGAVKLPAVEDASRRQSTLTRPSATLSHPMGEGRGEGSFYPDFFGALRD